MKIIFLFLKMKIISNIFGTNLKKLFFLLGSFRPILSYFLDNGGFILLHVCARFAKCYHFNLFSPKNPQILAFFLNFCPFPNTLEFGAGIFVNTTRTF